MGHDGRQLAAIQAPDYWAADRVTDPPPSLEQFVAGHAARLTGALTLYCGDREVGRDLAQEALIRLCRDWERVQRLDRPDRWLLRVGVNLANSRFRRAAAERRAFLRHGLAEASADETADVAEREDVRAALGTLQRRRREALVLRYYLGWSVEEVAVQMRCSTNAVSSLTSRALSDLRAALGRDLSDA